MGEAIGWVGGVAFAVCGLPQAITCHRQGHANGIDAGFLGLWLLGEVCTLIYVLLDVGLAWPLLVNYGANLVLTGAITYYKLFPRVD